MLHVFNISEQDYVPEYLSGFYVPGRPSCMWYGRLKEMIDLPKWPETGVLQQLFAREIGAKFTRAGPPGKRFGFNLTFTAPKGVSVAALVGDSEVMLNAHEHAVFQALEYVENHMLFIRKTENKETRHSQANGMLAALFHRTTSRSLDPLLHTQVILFNFTRRSDETFCALEAGMLYHAKHTIGLVYRAALANRLAEAQISMNWVGDLCDIDCVDIATKERFSTRSLQIQKKLKSLGKDKDDASAQLITKIARLSAPQVAPVSFDEMQARWKTACRDTITVRTEPGGVTFPYDAGSYDQVLETFHHLLGTKNGVGKHELLAGVLAASQGYVLVDDIEPYIEFMLEEDVCKSAGFPETLFSTQGFAAYQERRRERSQLAKAATPSKTSPSRPRRGRSK